MRRPLLALVAASLFFTSMPASAQDDPRKAQAAPSFEEGRKLAEQGRNAEALDKFRKAHEIYPSPNTLFNIARMEQVLRQRLAALRDFREALRNPVLLPQLAPMARDAIAELEQSLARLKIVGPPGTRVTIDDREYTLPVEAPIDVNPGMTEVKGRHGSDVLSAIVEAHAGTITPVELQGPKASSSDGVTLPPIERGTEPSSARFIVSGALGLVGLVGVGVGFVQLARAEGQIDDAVAYRQSVSGGACAVRSSETCAEYGRMLDDVGSTRGVATGAFIAGGVFVAGAILTFVLWPKSVNEKTALVPWLSPTRLGLGGAF